MTRIPWRRVAVGVLGALAVAAQSPTLRRVNILALQAGGDRPVEVAASCQAHGAYADLLRARLFEPDGRLAGSARAAVGETLRLILAPGAPRRLALELNSGWNVAALDLPPEVPWALVARPGQPLQTIREWGPLCFYVPPETATVTLWIRASVTNEAAHLRIAAQDGTVLLQREDDFDRRTQLRLEVPPGQADAVWSVSLLPCAAPRHHTDDVELELGPQVPGFLSPRAEWSRLFAAGWTPAPAALSSRLPPRPAVRAPYRPTPSAALDAALERRAGAAWQTSLPVTYVLDYGANHLGNPDYVPAVATAPPALLHLGKDVVFNHAWGPVRALGGENQAYGHGEAITRLSPEEAAARLDGLRQMVAALHEAGVRYVTPYICGMTLNGDPQRRSGFWEFYDHWDDYRGLGLGPRPAQDPLEWLQRNADGTPRLYYRYDIDAGFYPPFKDNHRYAACWHTTGWRTWLLEVVRFVARTGCDGVFVDNGCSQKSRSPAALAAFRAFLKERWTAAQARDLLGIADLDAAAFPGDRDEGLAAVEMQRFWCATLRDQMAAIRAAGTAELGRDFVVFPNGGRPSEIQAALSDTDFVMFEKSIGEYGTNPGLVLQPVFDGVTLRVINDSLFDLLFVRSLRSRVRPIILTRGGYPSTRPEWVLNPDAARLGMAECAAFSGGGGFLLTPRFDAYHDALNDLRAFIEGHPDLHAGLLPWTDTAVLALAEQVWHGNSDHMGQVRRLTPLLADAHVRFDLLPESRLDAAALSEAGVVVACAARVLAESHLQALARFVDAGGRLVVAGAFADQDEYRRDRPALPAPLAGLRDLADGQSLRAGAGEILRADSDEALVDRLAPRGLALTRDGGRPAPGVRVASYRSPDGQRLVLHLVNYHVPLGVDPPPVEAVADLSLAVPLPAGRTLRGFRVLSSDVPGALPAEVTLAEGIATVRLPQLRIHAVVELVMN
ncbi:MAG: hypothetical protein GX595_21060 [Lentisphaerae bacterium]|nr:hypothetical protein [Lentisphaerota bacterium]